MMGTRECAEAIRKWDGGTSRHLGLVLMALLQFSLLQPRLEAIPPSIADFLAAIATLLLLQK